MLLEAIAEKEDIGGKRGRKEKDDNRRRCNKCE